MRIFKYKKKSGSFETWHFSSKENNAEQHLMETVLNICKNVKVGKYLLTRWLDYNWFYSLKELAHFLFQTFGGFLYVPTAQIYCLTGAIISETRRMIYI